MSGPAPKRSEERRRRNSPATDRTASKVGKRGPKPPEWLTGLGRRWYESLRTSGQSVYYVDSDWATALVYARAVMAFEVKPSAMLLASIHQGLAALAVTEGERRRLRLELSDNADRDDPDEVAALSMIAGYRREAG